MADTSSRVRLIFEGSERGVVAAAAKSAAAIRALNDENTKVGKSFAAADQRATKFIGTVTQVAAKTSVVAAAGGAVGQAFAGALPIITALGVGSLTVKLGMDGIKKAAEGAKKPFEDLKKAVSGTFEKELKGPVQDVAGLLPKLTSGFQGVAKSISGAAGEITGFAASARGVEVLKAVLAGTASFIDGLGPQLANFLDGFLSAVASAKNEMRGFGDAFGSIFGQLGTVLQTLANDEMSTFAKAIAGGAASLRGLGNVIASVVDVAVRLGAAFGDSFGVLLNGLADGIGRAAPGLVDLGSALGDLFRAISPLLPVIGELAGQFAHSLADGIRAVIPYVQQFAAWAQNNVGTIKAVTEGIVALAVGVKALSIFTSVVGWVDGVVGVLGRFTGSAKAAEAGAGRLAGAMGTLKGIGAAAALAAVAVALDDINTAAAGGGDNLQGFERNLHNLVGAGKQLASGDIGGIIRDIGAQVEATNATWKAGQAPVQQWSLAVSQAATNAATSVQNFFRGLVGLPPLPPLKLDVDPTTGQAHVNEFVGGVSRTRGVTQLDADPAAANAKLGGWKGSASATVGTAVLAADPANANTTTTAWAGHAAATTGTANLAANPAGANAQLGGWKGRADATTGTSTLNANPAQANAQTSGWKGRADGTTGTSKLNADPAQANSQTSGWQGRANTTTGTAHLHAEDGSARSTVNSFVAWASGLVVTVKAVLQKIGFAHGGPVGLAGGGAISGRGTSTSDSIPAMLSTGEHVLSAAEVRAAGGHAAIFALRKSLLHGRVPRMHATGGRAATGGAVSGASAFSIPTPQVAVSVHIGNQEITDIVRTQINASNRATRRTVGMGAGTTF